MEREIPQDRDAEGAVIGSLLIDNSQWDGIDLSPDDFMAPTHKLLFSAMQALEQRGQPTDQISVAHEVKARGQIDEIGGLAILAELTAKIPTSLNCHYYAAIVRRMSAYRRLLSVAGSIGRLAYETPTDISDTFDAADKMLLDIRTQYSKPSIVSPKDRAELATQRYTELSEHPGTVATATGFVDLDRALGGGLMPGELIVLAASSGLGKSTLARNIANNVVGPVLFCSNEMSVDGHTDRDIAEAVGTDISTIRNGNYEPKMLTAIIKAAGGLADKNVHMFPDSKHMRYGLSVSGIQDAADQLSAREGQLKLIVVDYLQRLRSNKSRGDKRYLEIGDMTSELADLAKAQQCPVLLLSQVSRELDRRPVLSDLYESGRIEQDADMVLFLYRLSYYVDRFRFQREYDEHPEWHTPDRKYPEHIAEIIIAKQRQGGHNGTRYLYYDEKTGYRGIINVD